MATNNNTQQILCLQNIPFYSLNKICAALAMALPLSFTMPASAGLVTQDVVFTSLNQSMWGEGESTVFSNFDNPIFIGAEWNQSGKLFEIGKATNGNNGVKVEGQTSGKIGLETGWSIDSGTVNTQLPFSFEIDIPDRRNLTNNGTFAFGVTSATLDSQAFLETVSPSLQLYADLIVKAQASLDVQGCYDAFFTSDCGSASVELLDFDTTRELLSVNTGPDRDNAEKDGQIRVLDGFKELFAAGATAKDLIETEKDENGKTKKVSIKLEPVVSVGGSPIIEVDVRIPDITEKSTLSNSVNLGGNGQNNILGTSGTDEFLNLNVDIDQLGTNLRILPPLGGNASVDFGVGSISTEFDLLDLSFIPSLSLDQDFSLSIDKIGVSYEIQRFDNLGNIFSTQLLVANNLTDEFNLIWNDNQSINITPIYQISASLHNQTGVSVNFDFNVDILKGSISAEIFGIDIGNDSFGPLAQLGNFDLPSADLLTLFSNSFDLGGFSKIAGETIGLGFVNRTFDGSGTDEWGQNSSWVENSAPNDFANVQVIDGRVFVVDNQQSGDLSVDSGAFVDIRGKLTIEGRNINNNGTIEVTGESVNNNFGNLEINALNLSGNGDIILTSGILTSSDSNIVRFIRGQDIVIGQSFFPKDSQIQNISLQLSNGSVIENNFAESLIIRNSVISTVANNVFSLSGLTSLENSTLSNIGVGENASLTIRSNQSATSNNSFWNVGDDGIVSIGSGANVNVTSFFAGIENSLTLLGQKNGVAEINNNGLIEISSEFSQPGASARVNLTANNTLFSGNGSIELIDGAIFGDTGEQALTNGTGHTIRGTGFLYLNRGAIVNDGDIWAEKLTTDETTSNRLSLFGRLTNNGTIGATGANQEFTLDNTEGITNITLSNNIITPNLAEGSMTLTGGTWAAENGGVLRFNVEHAINNFFTNRSNIIINGSSSDIRMVGRLEGSGQLLSTKLDDAYLSFNNQGNLTLIDNDFTSSNMFNTGVINMSNNSFLSGLDKNEGKINITFGSELTGLKSNASGAVIEGSGGFTNARGLINDGTMRANGSRLWLLLGSGNDVAFTNNAKMESVDGGFLRLSGLHERAGNRGQAEFAGGNDWGAYASDERTTAIVIDARVSGDVQGIKSLYDTNLTLSGLAAHFYTRVNNSFIDLAQSLELIDESASLTLANGQVFQTHKQVTNGGTLKLVEGVYTGVNIVNDGSIVGHGSVLSNITNNNTIKAEGGLLSIFGSIDNTNGLIEVGSGGINAAGEQRDVLNITSNFVQGGEILIKENATLNGFTYFIDVLLNNKGTMDMDAGIRSGFLLAAGSSNSGVLMLDNGADAFFSDLFSTELNNTSGTISSNNGVITLSNYTINGGEIVLTGASSNLNGVGTLNDVALNVSNGTVSAQSNGQEGSNQLKISTSQLSQLNSATLQANKDSILLLENAQFSGKGGATILANNDANVLLQNVVLNNISLDTDGNGKITDLATSHLTNVLIAGNVDIASTGLTNLYGINVLSGNLSTTGGSEIVMHGARLTGQNFVTEEINGETEVLSVVTPGNLTISAGATLRGVGTIDLVNISNNGAMIADGAQALIIDVNGERFDNAGMLRADGAGGLNLRDELVVNTGSVEVNSTLSITGDYEQLSGTTRVNGRVSSGSFIILDGSLDGNGLIESQVYLGESAELNMLGSLDSLTIANNMDLLGLVSVDLFSLDSFDTLSVIGDLNLSETTQFLFELATSIELFDNISFEFLFFENVFNLDLLSPSNISFNRDISGYKWMLALNDDETSLRLRFVDVNAPAQIALFLLGLAYLIRRKGFVKQ